MKCVEQCEFQKFAEGCFYCLFYDGIILTADKPLSIDKGDKIIIHRCEKCVEEELIGSNTTLETARKLKQYLGTMADEFYTFKDEFETGLTEMYRLIKGIEYNAENESEMKEVKDES